MGNVAKGSDYFGNVLMGSNQGRAVYLGGTKVWPPDPLETSYTSAGSYTYTVPSWFKFGFDYIDVFALGGGGGGGGYWNYNGQGGRGGRWALSSFQPTNTTISVIVGGGGSGQNTSQGNTGGTSSVTNGSIKVTSYGGIGGEYGGASNGADNYGQGPSNETRNTVTHNAGNNQTSNGGAGNAPGGGGGGASWLGTGGSGAAGAVWIRARSVADENDSQVRYVSNGDNTVGTVTSGSPSTFAHWVTPDTDALLVWVARAQTAAAGTVSVKIGSTSLAQLLDYTYWTLGSNDYGIMCFGILNPPVNNQTVTVSNTSGTIYIASTSVAYKNVSGFGTTASNGSGSGTSSSLSIASAANRMVSCAFTTGTANGASQYSFNKTSRFDISAETNTNTPLLVGDSDGASSVSFSMSHVSAAWGAGAVNLLN